MAETTAFGEIYHTYSLSIVGIFIHFYIPLALDLIQVLLLWDSLSHPVEKQDIG